MDSNDTLWRYISRNSAFYVMLIPGVLYFLVFKYAPLLGSIIAFQDYDIYKGFAHSEWVGFRWFWEFFTFPQFQRLLWNTIVISFYQLIFAFPAPIVIALLLNELRHVVFKRTVQTIVYLPHFLSWVIVGGFAYMLLSPRIGLVNQWIMGFGQEPVLFLQDPAYTRGLIVASGIWKEMGWSAIVFLAALSGISPSLYEAAKIDGAGRWKQLLHITLPGLLPVIMLLLLLKIGHILDLGFEQIYVFLNPMTFETADVIDTYTVRIGLTKNQYSLTTAIGLFKSVVGFLLLIVANRLSRSATGEGLY
ncbi:ABC transporter permease [Paenibacillus koleovorans]|uniref:ABC transporter permease n=1 Tax=Paenibacillus koleovorans TaxID=121608 RepID=UPI001FE819C7|nr:ABC transporter permease subunit [Paenibacillus koleovorans]